MVATSPEKKVQKFKTVYFADKAAASSSGRNLKIAFGAADESIFNTVNLLSSDELRRAIGFSTYDGLKSEAERRGLAVNALCLNQLRQLSEPDPSQLSLPSMGENFDFLIDPIQTTYRGGINEQLHGWYPYLEGYSPDFVQTAIRSFAPDARHVLDPFAGTGTTPLTAVRTGLTASYCELNPLLQHVIAAKGLAVGSEQKVRTKWATTLRDAALRLSYEIADYAQDERLKEAYRRTFGESVFFSEGTFRDVLRLRTWLDALDCAQPQTAALATVAVLASLVPASELIRKGDLRFRKGLAEKNAKQSSVIEDVKRRLCQIATDIEDVSEAHSQPRLICGDAKLLHRVPPIDADIVVTSPPYLNGTNYYRNTKLELWFLRSLNDAEDLASFRRRTVTAGINDVTVEKVTRPLHPSAEDVIQRLSQGAYDRRIPQMARGYFSDMADVFDALHPHLKQEKPLVIDIGDSMYAGVHVDTPSILANMLTATGWQLDRQIELRPRQSKGGMPLKQTLLVAKKCRAKARTARSKPNWGRKWLSFMETLPHQRGEFSKRNWGSPLHSLCSYQGKMKPSLAHHLVATFVSTGARVLDPFGGVGTIPFEVALAGSYAWSFDISPAAVAIAKAKLECWSPECCEAVLEQIGRFIDSHRATARDMAEVDAIRFNGALSSYFHPDTLLEIIAARRYFLDRGTDDANVALVFACLLHILHGNRPYALSRNSHPITPFSPTGPTPYKRLVTKLREKVSKAIAVDRGRAFQAGHSLFQDATAVWPCEVDNLDAVITSPPFFDSTRFYLANWMRLWFSGWTSNDFRTRPRAFVDERQKETFEIYQAVLRQARERLVSGGVCVMHLGKSRKCDMAEEIRQVAKTWFRHADIFAESVEHCESHGIRDKGTVVEHTYLVLH